MKIFLSILFLLLFNTECFAITELDYMEYSSDALAQAAYVTNAAEVVDQSDPGGTNYVALGDVSGVEYRHSQSFKLSQELTVTAVEIKQGTVGDGSPTGNWTIRIETNNAGVPSGTLANVNASKVVAPPGVNTIIKATFDTPFVLSGATTYWIVILCDNQSNSNYWRLSCADTGSYADGNRVSSTTGGASWNDPRTDADFYFKVYAIKALQCFSESTIKTQGSYALKGVAAQCDAYDTTYTKLVSHFDGADAAVAYTDPIAGAYTFVGTAQLDTAQKKFGTSSLLLDGNSDYVSLPDSTNWSFGSGDFTIEAWVRFNSLTDMSPIVVQYNNSENFWFFRKDATVDGNNLRIRFVSSSVAKGQYHCSWSPATNTWYHLVAERIGTSAKIFIDGVSQSLTETTAFGTNDVGDIDSLLKVGSYGDSYLNGWIDELRISKGIARWTADFTPPTEEYPFDSGGSLNKTLTRTISPPIDLSGKNTIKLDSRSNRTGSNVKVGFHDSGGTTTEITPNIASANTYQTDKLDISAVSDANKDAIDSIITTVVNADAANTFYIDNVEESSRRIVIID